MQAQTPAPRVLWILWIAYLNSVLIFGGVGFFVRSQLDQVPEDDVLVPVLAMALLMGVVASVVVSLGGRVAAAQLPTWQTWFLIRCAFAELPTLVGFVGFYLGGPALAFVAMLAWSLGLLLLCMPTARDREAWEQAKRGRSH